MLHSVMAAFFLCAGVLPAQDVAAAWKDLMVQGQYAANSRNYAGAQQIFRHALHESERFGADDTRVVTTLVGLGQAYESGKEFPDAEACYRRAIAILDKGDVAQNMEFADANLHLAAVLIEQGKQAAAFPLLARSLSIYVRQEGGDSLKAAAAHCLAGEAYRGMKSWQEAEVPLKRCAQIREADGGVMNAMLGDALFSLAVVYDRQGKYALADSRYKLVEKIREKTQGIMSPGFADVLEAHSAMLKAMGRHKEAGQDAALAAAIRRHQQSGRAGRGR
jgi:tetratricopeptide (TPR) repeat protein